MLTLWINLYRVPLDSFPILFGGPQKMITGLFSVRCSSSLIFRTTRKTLEWATTLREVWFPTSLSYPMVGASFIRITHSVRSISSPAPVPRTWLELVTSAQLWQCRVIFLTKKKKKETFYTYMMPGRINTNYFSQSNSFLICAILSASTGFTVIKLDIHGSQEIKYYLRSLWIFFRSHCELHSFCQFYVSTTRWIVLTLAIWLKVTQNLLEEGLFISSGPGTTQDAPRQSWRMLLGRGFSVINCSDRFQIGRRKKDDGPSSGQNHNLFSTSATDFLHILNK